MRWLTTLVFSLVAAVTLPAADLDEILARMDRTAESFTDVTASVEKVNFTAIINDTEVETGRIWMSRAGGARMRIEFGEPDPRSLAMAGRKGEIYYPKLNLVNEYDLGDFRSTVQQYLMLGFGTSGRNLAKDYQLKVTGEEDLAGVATTRLELVPKGRQARERMSRAELWVSNEGGHPLRQKLYLASGDTATLTYSDVAINPGLSPSDLALDLPADVKREFPQR